VFARVTYRVYYMYIFEISAGASAFRVRDKVHREQRAVLPHRVGCPKRNSFGYNIPRKTRLFQCYDDAMYLSIGRAI